MFYFFKTKYFMRLREQKTLERVSQIISYTLVDTSFASSEDDFEVFKRRNLIGLLLCVFLIIV
jgi:hypothetical protein